MRNIQFYVQAFWENYRKYSLEYSGEYIPQWECLSQGRKDALEQSLMEILNIHESEVRNYIKSLSARRSTPENDV